MTINIGNKELKDLIIGDKPVLKVYKGDDLIYKSFERMYGFRFTIKATAGTSVNVAYFTGYDIVLGKNFPAAPDNYMKIKIYYGDGASDIKNIPISSTSYSYGHTYSADGEYQVLIVPELRPGETEPAPGWLSGLQFQDSLVSIDTKFPPGSVVFFPGGTSILLESNGIASKKPRPWSNIGNNFSSYPDGVYDNITFLPSAAASGLDNFCNSMFQNSRFKYVNVIKFASEFIKQINTTGATSLLRTFYRMFSGSWFYLQDKANPVRIFPDGFGDGIEDFSEAFREMFYNPSAGDPAVTFNGLDTSDGKLFDSAFYQTFYGSTRFSIPSDMFRSLDTSNATSMNQAFRGTFYSSGRLVEDWSIPADLFAGVHTPNVTNFKYMFANTFAMSDSYPHTTLTGKIPAGLFDSIDTSSGTDLSYMFNGTFSWTFVKTNEANPMPEDLFTHLDLSSATTTHGMFQNVFGGTFRDAPNATIAQRIFPTQGSTTCTDCAAMYSQAFYKTFLKTTATVSVSSDIFIGAEFPNALTTESMFSWTFREMCNESYNVTIPQDIFRNVKTANSTNFNSMFSHTFYWEFTNNTVRSKPFGNAISDTMFSSLNTSNGVNFGSMFYNTFTSVCEASTTGTLPEHIFDFLNTSNGTDFSDMFHYTFYGTFRQSKDTTAIPELFRNLDTSNGTNFAGMFNGTFYDAFGVNGSLPDVTIPATLFDIDTSAATNTSGMFSYTFHHACEVKSMNWGARKVRWSIPATLFSYIDTSHSTNVSQMFNGTFYGTMSALPTGLFGNLDFSSVTSDNNKKQIFSNIMESGWITSRTTVPLNDVFDGMTDFTWVDSSNAATVLSNMFACSSTNYGVDLTGSASTILQHFNFTPAADTNMFRNQTNLTDYATLDPNWV